MEPMNRPLRPRSLLAALVLGAVLVAPGAAPVARADEGAAAGPPELTPRVLEAVHRGLEYLKESQREDGAWDCNIGFKINDTYKVTTYGGRHPGVTALAGTAFLAGGHLPGRGPYGDALNRAVDYILSAVDDKGYITENHTRMYSHAFATLFLAEVYGSSLDRKRNEKVRDALSKAVQFILGAQNDQGGWRYEALAVDSDMSITVCQVMALRAARNKGVSVPQKSIDAAVEYVLLSAVTDGGRNGFRWGDGGMRRGAFKYQYREKNQIGTRASLALTAAAMTTLFGAGLYDDRAIQSWAQDHGIARYAPGRDRTPTIEDMATYILEEYDDHARGYGNHYFWFYGHYYASQAMYIAGGRSWEKYYPLVRDHLLRRQDPDGSWEVRDVGRTFGTAVACVILQVPARYLPVLDQR